MLERLKTSLALNLKYENVLLTDLHIISYMSNKNIETYLFFMNDSHLHSVHGFLE